MSSDATATARKILAGPAGAMEILVDTPPGTPAGIAIIAHPHPLEGGNAEHKIPQGIAKACQRNGWLAVRPNFRGVGASAGAHDAGEGETLDLLAVADALQAEHPGLPLLLAGFSFGAYVQTRVAALIAARGGAVDRVILVGTPVGTVRAHRHYDTPPPPDHALVIHGEADEIASVEPVLAWARPQKVPVVVLPGANHFLTGHMHRLLELVERHLK
jgi:alpha/beta superfamily hydrolase